MINFELLERLYRSYGFDLSQEREKLPVFLYQKSRYFGVDIILTSEDVENATEAARIKEKYAKLGFAVNIKPISSNEEAETELFKSFFSYESTIERSKRKYQDFQKKQTKNLFGNEYEYVESPFEIHNHHEREGGIFNAIKARFSSDRAELIIIEAAAGYGKTCTAYEILHYLTAGTGNQLPMFTELARNRSAKIFKYILLDEINSEYPALNYDLVTKEIKNGRIPLLIDGFDELLVKADSEAVANDAFEEVESMLDTIGMLLEHKTKIVLTTRKTAIFTGVEFENWLRKWNDKFHLTRILIREPRLEDWLGEQKNNYVQERGVPIENLSNPVILTFLKNIPLEEYISLMDHPDMLVQHYFNRMLEREKIRQNLYIPVEKQLEIFRNVVRMLLEFDTTAEEKEFFKEMILDQNRKSIDYYRSLYPATEKPTLEGLVDTLSNHALLDRKGRDQSQVGFINDFVLGTLIGQIITELPAERIEKEVSVNMMELAVTAYRVQNVRNKSALWEKIESVKQKFLPTTLFTFDTYLKNSLQRSFSEVSVSDLSFFNVHFVAFSIESSVFINCRFKNCVFESEKLHDATFIDCTFETCTVIDGLYIDNKNGVIAIKCSQAYCTLLIEKSSAYTEEKMERVSDFEKAVLQRLWSISISKGHHILKLMESFGEQHRRKVNEALKTLEEKQYIKISGFFIRFEMNKMHIIKEILEIPHELSA